MDPRGHVEHLAATPPPAGNSSSRAHVET